MRMLIWLILIYVGFKIVKGFMAGRKIEEPVNKPGEETVRDPVCGIYMAKEDAITGNLEGEKFHFCSMECLEKFRDQLDKKEKEAIRQ
jgi:YHS domain-containing protein